MILCSLFVPCAVHPRGTVCLNFWLIFHAHDVLLYDRKNFSAPSAKLSTIVILPVLIKQLRSYADNLFLSI